MGINYHSPAECGLPSTPRRWRTDRKFLPLEIYGKDHDLETIGWPAGYSTAVACPRPEHNCADCGSPSVHVGAIIIAVDGTCRSTPTVWGPSAIGVYFAKDSPWNIMRRRNKPMATSQTAELQACMAALDMAMIIKKESLEEDLSQVIIKAHSDYVFKGMTEWTAKWAKNGWLNAKGMPVANGELFQQVEQKIIDLNDLGVEVLFWQVPRSQNQEADTLANSVFEKPRRP
ncbi:hypothetical protein JMJ35_003420 [Cladonia borealis]|uniref:ribonuclease H n=1 Tax=Cladonia borealis TaxID=184061 RepID=A0AA39R5H9_9LECA|nr:hypothetical protein JMJ35_003420 [Cladonia borealis]